MRKNFIFVIVLTIIVVLGGCSKSVKEDSSDKTIMKITGSMESSFNPVKSVTEYEFDKNVNITGVNTSSEAKFGNTKGNVIYSYGNGGRLEKSTYNMSSTYEKGSMESKRERVYNYDTNGRLISVEETTNTFKGTSIINYTYTGDKITSIKREFPYVTETLIEYDSLGRIAKITNDMGENKFLYDNSGFLVKNISYSGELSYKYDNLGRISNIEGSGIVNKVEYNNSVKIDYLKIVTFLGLYENI